MLVESNSFKFNSSDKLSTHPVKDKKDITSKGCKKPRVIWNNAYNNDDRFNFAAKASKELNFFTKKKWKKVIIDGKEVLGNINSIAKRFNISKQIINESSPEELGALLKMIAADSKPQASSDRLANFGEIMFIGNLVDALIPYFETAFDNSDGLRNSALRNNLIIYFTNKLIFNQESNAERKMIEKFIPAKELSTLILTKFCEAVNNQPIRSAERERVRLLQGKEEGKVFEIETRARLDAIMWSRNQVTSPSYPMINIFIYARLRKGLPNNIMVPQFFRLINNLSTALDPKN